MSCAKVVYAYTEDAHTTKTQTTKKEMIIKGNDLYRRRSDRKPYQEYLNAKDKPQQGLKERKRKISLVYVNICPPKLCFYQAWKSLYITRIYPL